MRIGLKRSFLIAALPRNGGEPVYCDDLSLPKSISSQVGKDGETNLT